MIVYTDGSMLNRPRRGGYAYRIIQVDSNSEESEPLDFNPPGFLGATNNQMELMACVEALSLLASTRSPIPRCSYSKIVIYTDSSYVQENIGTAENVWATNGWLTRANEPVQNPDLWKDLIRLHRNLRVDFRKVKGHGKNPHNRAVDKLAKDSARAANRKMLSPPIVGRKSSNRSVDHGVVPMKGQTELIRIVSINNMRGQPYHSYRYEVVDPQSEHFEAVDMVFAKDAEVQLRRMHIYEVQFSEGDQGRWIENVVREIERPFNPSG